MPNHYYLLVRQDSETPAGLLLDGPEVAETHLLDKSAGFLHRAHPPLRGPPVIEFTLALNLVESNSDHRINSCIRVRWCPPLVLMPFFTAEHAEFAEMFGGSQRSRRPPRCGKVSQHTYQHN